MENYPRLMIIYLALVGARGASVSRTATIFKISLGSEESMVLQAQAASSDHARSICEASYSCMHARVKAIREAEEGGMRTSGK